MQHRTRTLVLGAVTAVAVAAFPAASQAAATGDPLSGKQWGLDQVRAPAAWATSTGAGTVVAVVDSGVDLDHPDLAGQLVPGATFINCGKQVSVCGDGDWVGQDGTPQEADSHGTHVAGIIAAATGNGVGIAGVARDAKIMPLKALEDGTGDFVGIANAIRYAVDRGADVVNLSIGADPGAQAFVITGLETSVQDAITYARSKGVVVVAAAGNETAPLCSTPAFDTGALCVTSTDRREAPSWFSNLGLKPDLQAVAAPGGAGVYALCGEEVLSTVPVGTGQSEVCGNGKDYDEYAGTSMASPHVAGVAALLVAQGRTDDQVMEALLTTSRQPQTSVRGVFTPSYGWGIVDAVAALASPYTPAGGGGGTQPSPSPSPSKTPKGGKGGGNR